MLMIGSVGVDYLGEGIGPAPFSTDHPPPMGHLLTEMVLEPPFPPSTVEWDWMVMPPMGTPNASVLVFGPPPTVAPMTCAGVADGGSHRC